MVRPTAHLGELARAERHPLFALRELGGWESPKMVRRYANFSAGHNQTVALTSQFAGKQPLMRRPAPGDRRPPSGGPLTHWKAPPYHGARQQRSFDCRGTG